MEPAAATPTTLETSDERESRRLAGVGRAVLRDRRLRAAALLGLAWLVCYAAATFLTADVPRGRQFLGSVLYILPVALAAALAVTVARRARGRARRFWWLLASSNLLWTAGELVWGGYIYVLSTEPPFPSIADGLYLASYALVPVALLVAFGSASGHRRVRGVLDACVVAAALGAVGWQLLIAPQLGWGMSWATATGVAYPLLGIVILVTLLSVGFAGHRHVPPSVRLVGVAFAVSAITDAGYTYLAVLHEYVTGDWLNLGWQIEAVLLCLAAAIGLRHKQGDGQVTRFGSDLGLVPVVVAVAVGLGLLTAAALDRSVAVWTVVLAWVVVAGLAVRSVLSVADTGRIARELAAALREQERLAVSDGLTGLYNRRFFEEVLRLEVERAQRDGGQLALLVVDLDNFKRINDRYGHQNGDAVLAEAAARLRRALRDSDVLARYGGEEFVVILPDTDTQAAREIAERCRRGLSDDTVRLHDGTRITVTGSFGGACLPEDALEVDQLIRLADRALYAAKDDGRDRTRLSGDASSVAGDLPDPAQHSRPMPLVPRGI